MNSSSDGGPCWICRSQQNDIWKSRSLTRPLEPADLQITDAGYGNTLTLRKCSACGFVFADGPEIPELERLYEQLEDSQYQNTQDSRRLQMRWLLRKSLSLLPHAKTWLDVGAGAGLIVSEVRALGLEAVGVEPSHSLVAAARSIHGVELIQGTFPHPELRGRSFDVISVVDVIEHVSNPVGLLTECTNSLSRDGIIICVTPDRESVTARLLGKRWWHYRLAHVGYFDRANLERAGDIASLAPLAWYRPKWFFPVRYLAERAEQYLPLKSLNRLASRLPAGEWLYDRVISVDFRDSWVVVFGRKKSA